jgi:hypothetical protein
MSATLDASSLTSGLARAAGLAVVSPGEVVHNMRYTINFVQYGLGLRAVDRTEQVISNCYGNAKYGQSIGSELTKYGSQRKCKGEHEQQHAHQRGHEFEQERHNP